MPDLAEAMSAAGHRNGMAFGLARAQLAMGKSWAMRDESGVAVAVAGLVEADRATADAWFVVAPVSRAALLSIVRAIRLTLKAEGYRQIRVVLTTAEGARLARLAGLDLKTGD